MNFTSVNTKLVKLIVQCTCIKMNTDKRFVEFQYVIATLMVGDYDTEENKLIHGQLRKWAVKNETKLLNILNKSSAEIAEIERWNKFIDILDHITLQMATES